MRTSRITFFAKSRILALLSLVVTASSLCSAGSITYYVNQTIGAGSVTGDIVTDGTIGVFTQGLTPNVLDWNLLLNDGTNKFDLVGPQGSIGVYGVQEAVILGGDVSATATQLLFNFSGTDGGVFFFETGDSGAVCFETGPDCIARGFGAGESLSATWGGTGYTNNQYRFLSGTQVVATTSSVPEPFTFALLGTGIGLLGLRKPWSKRQRSCSSR